MGDNRSTVVGDTSRYSAAASSGGALTGSVGGSGTGSVHEVRDGGSIQAAVAAAQPGDVIEITQAPTTKPSTSIKTISC